MKLVYKDYTVRVFVLKLSIKLLKYFQVYYLYIKSYRKLMPGNMKNLTVDMDWTHQH